MPDTFHCNKFSKVLFAFLFFAGIQNAFCQSTFVKLRSSYTANSIQQTFDDGFIFIESTFTSAHIILTKCDKFGNLQWTKEYGGDSLEWSGCLEQTADSGYIIAGHTKSFGVSNFDMYVIKTDSAGNVIWSKTYGGPMNESAIYVHQVSDGGYYIIGGISGTGILSGISVIRVDNTGTLLWTKIYNVLNNRLAVSNACPAGDGGFAISGRIWGGGLGDCPYFLKIDSLGNLQWDKYYANTSGGFLSSAYSVIQGTDGSYFIAGCRSANFGTGSNTYFNIIKTDSVGNMLWEKFYSDSTLYGDDAAGVIKQTSDGGFVTFGSKFTPAAGGGKLYVVKTDYDGNLQWSRTYGIPNTSGGGNGGTISKDGGYFAIGSLELTSAYPVNIIKTDSLGFTACNVFTPNTIVLSYAITGASANGYFLPGSVTESNAATIVSAVIVSDTTLCYSTGLREITAGKAEIQISPVPCKGIFSVNINQTMQEGLLAIYDVTGKKVYSEIFTGSYKTVKCKLNSGIYFLKLADKEKMFSGKLVVE